jgi:hypothetical protein
VSATASSGLPVSFIASGNCTITGATVHLTGPGSCTITAQQSGNIDYDPAPDVPQTFTIATPGVVGLDSVTFGAKNALIDGASVRVFSNGPITLQGKVDGNVRSAAAGVTVKKDGLVTGDVIAGTTITVAAGGAINGTSTENSPTEPLAPDAVAPCSPFSDASGISGAFTYDAAKGDLTVKGGKTAALAGGTYCFHNVTVGGGATLRADGAVTLVLTAKLDVGGGSKLLTASSSPSDLKIRSSYTGNGGVSFGGGATGYAQIYAPKTDVALNGGSVLNGSVLGRSLSLTADSAVHYSN